MRKSRDSKLCMYRSREGADSVARGRCGHKRYFDPGHYIFALMRDI